MCWNSCLIDPSSNNGERLIRKTEYHMGDRVTKSVAIARRKGLNDKTPPQIQMFYCECSSNSQEVNSKKEGPKTESKRIFLLS